MEGGIHVYCINLKHRADRWERFSKQPELEELKKNYGFERYEAVNGSAVDIINDNRISLRTKRNVKEHIRRDHEELDSAGGVGCYLSHTNVWKKFLERPEPYAIILEDDAYLHTGFVQDLHNAMKDTTLLPQMPDIWYFNKPSQFYYDNKGRIYPDQIKARNIGPWITQTCGIFNGYLISKKGAEKLLETAFPLDMHVDLYTCLSSDLNRIFSVSHRGLLVNTIGLKKNDSDITAESDCPICDIPTKFQQRGMVLISVPLLFIGLTAMAGMYYLGTRRRRF